MSDSSVASTPRRARGFSSARLARRFGKWLLLKSARVDALITERRNLRTAKGILQIEKGELEAVVRELNHRFVNPPAPHPPTNPAAHIPATVPRSGQAYREYLTRQIYAGAPSPTIAGLPNASEFLQIVKGSGGTGRFGPRWTVFDISDSTPAVGSRGDASSLPADWTERFALVLCNAVLEHIAYPQRAVDDFYRVLTPGGYLYLEVAFWQPYPAGRDPDAVGEARSYEDYWRATVEGLRVWAAALDEISCGWADEGVVYYFGVKPSN